MQVEDSIFGNTRSEAGLKRPCKSVIAKAAGANSRIPECLIYVRYKDHAIFKNVTQPPVEPVERETVGWLTGQTDELLLIQHDRAVAKKEKRVNGIIILRNCVIQAYRVSVTDCELTSNIGKAHSKFEFAFRPSERKTHGAKDSNRRSTKQ